jgi:hypothetical protein
MPETGQRTSPAAAESGRLMPNPNQLDARSWGPQESARVHIVQTVQWRTRNVIEVGLTCSGSSDLGAIIGYYIDPLGG